MQVYATGRETMNDALDSLGAAFGLIAGGDPAFYGIVLLSLRVTLTAVAIAVAIGMPVGAFLAIQRFPGRGALVVLFNALMGLPPVVAGLAVYLLLSRSGPDRTGAASGRGGSVSVE